MVLSAQGLPLLATYHDNIGNIPYRGSQNENWRSVLLLTSFTVYAAALAIARATRPSSPSDDRSARTEMRGRGNPTRPTRARGLAGLAGTTLVVSVARLGPHDRAFRMNV